MREEIEEVEGESGGVRVFLSDKGVEVLRKALAKKGDRRKRVQGTSFTLQGRNRKKRLGSGLLTFEAE